MKLALALLLVSTTASAAPYTITWHERAKNTKGVERTIDTVITVDGDKVHYADKYQGPDPDKPRNKPVTVDGTIKDQKAVADWLAKLDAVPVTPDKPADPKLDDETACITRGKATRCEHIRGDNDRTPGWKPIQELFLAITDGMKLHP